MAQANVGSGLPQYSKYYLSEFSMAIVADAWWWLWCVRFPGENQVAVVPLPLPFAFARDASFKSRLWLPECCRC